MSHEVLTEVLIGIVGIETTILLIAVWKLGTFLHSQLKARGDRDARNSKATP
jgi:hypothetical protein